MNTLFEDSVTRMTRETRMNIPKKLSSIVENISHMAIDMAKLKQKIIC